MASSWKTAAGASAHSERKAPVALCMEAAKISSILNSIESDVQRTYREPWQTMAIMQVQGGGKTQWRTQIQVTTPEPLAVAATAMTKKESEALVKIAFFNRLQEVGALDKLLPGRKLASAERVMPTKPPNCSPQPDLLRHCPSSEGAVGESVTRAKALVINVYDRLCRAKNDVRLKPQLETRMGTDQKWVADLTVRWPSVMSFAGEGQKKKEAEGRACLNLISYLQENEFIDNRLRPKLHTEGPRTQVIGGTNKAVSHGRPMPLEEVKLPPHVIPRMEQILHEFEGIVSEISCLQEGQEDYRDEDDVSFMDDATKEHVWDVMTGRRLWASDIPSLERRDHQLVQKNNMHRASSRHRWRESLPVYDYRDEIINMVRRNQVVVLAGETGCGKTTQVPQYIFEDCIASNYGSSCNIVVTQPRRIAAISMAERVAWERGEEVGDTVGYQVRLKRVALHQRGGIYFCTTGILLRHLQGNPMLQGISHVIVDEVHERDLDTDFLLIVLREVIKLNHSVTVVLMSATINTHTFSDYFGGAPIITIPGRLYPVRELYLEDLIDRALICPPRKDVKDPVKLAVHTVKYIYYNRPPGAILCFLPGWGEIMYVMQELFKVLPPRTHRWLLPLHSKLRHEDQRKIFDVPSNTEDVRKVILATNIAETSITVQDIVYVVDTGLHREKRFDVRLGVPMLGIFETSRSSMSQRKGRAGRLQAGECYYLFTTTDAMKRSQFPLPEIQRESLTQVVLSCKLFCPSNEVEAMLSQAPDPPPAETVHKAILDLQAMGIMDQFRGLTELGKCVVLFPMAPQLSKGLVYSAVFRCVKSVASLAPLMSEAFDLFNSQLSNVETRKAKLTYESTQRSDHIALMKMYCSWDAKTNPVGRDMFLQSMGMNRFSWELSKGLKDDYLRHLSDTGLVESPREKMEDWNHPVNQNARNCSLLSGIVTAAFYPNVLRRKKAHNRKETEFLCLNGGLAVIAEESVLQERKNECSWAVYFNAKRHYDGQRITVYDATEVSALHLLLFAGLEVDVTEDDAGSCSKAEDREAIITIDSREQLTFRASLKDAYVIARWRNMLHFLVELHLLPRSITESIDGITDLKQRLSPIIVEMTAALLTAVDNRH
ncbi:ATP-dependent RNA helicase DHX30-like [Ornithodoros turicata]|uniref:ATP-dependent RNA helicase DHX30-like n=1 Tax=Ornithodoros turicata TaxID=34597 RepID=UPI0031392D55